MATIREILINRTSGNAKALPDIRAEMERHQRQRQRMLVAFQAKDELTTGELQEFGTGCSSRLFELRKDYDIEAVYVQRGIWRYVFKGRKV